MDSTISNRIWINPLHRRIMCTVALAQHQGIFSILLLIVSFILAPIIHWNTWINFLKIRRLVQAHLAHMATMCIHQLKGQEHLQAHRPTATSKMHTLPMGLDGRINNMHIINNTVHHTKRIFMANRNSKRHHNHSRIHSKVCSSLWCYAILSESL